MNKRHVQEHVLPVIELQPSRASAVFTLSPCDYSSGVDSHQKFRHCTWKSDDLACPSPDYHHILSVTQIVILLFSLIRLVILHALIFIIPNAHAA
mmetsp:Transcript_120122/g.219883  ORF Transcript_120122/g.219883 Transcript_120122/m.219883 type:complete len:95 (-) Transcript_120122:216-500(-)